MRFRVSAALAALIFGTTAGVGSTGAYGQSNDDTRRMIEELQKQIEVLKDRLDKQEAQQKAQPAGPTAIAPAGKPPAEGQRAFLERKPGDNVTFFTYGGEATIYGNLDMSYDVISKGISGMTNDSPAGPGTGGHPVGNGGYMQDISTNISYLGIRGFQAVGTMPFSFVYQLETALDLSVSSGTVETNSNTSDVVRSGLTTRNTFMGLASPTFGSLKFGKTDTPYKTSTARMNAFSGMIGDYASIMGNTGGDNRVEFGVPRMEHSIWYESPSFAGLSGILLYSPGQNRAYDSSNVPSGSSDCAGGNVPGSGGLPVACNDGAFSNAYSVDLAYAGVKNLYVTTAYEMHRKVNRTSDLVNFATGNPQYDQGDVADEHAWKIGAQYRFPTKTTVNFIWEEMRRDVPGYLDVQNERSRNGFWFAVSQELTPSDSIHFGMAHAYATPGDPGQHNAAAQDTTFSNNPQGIPIAGQGHVDNSSTMLTAMVNHRFDRNLSIYFNWATQLNHQYGHYDLGAGGRGVTTDCHDASNPDTSGFDPNGGAPHCWAGGHLQGFSMGMNYRF
jgi:predicted porin